MASQEEKSIPERPKEEEAPATGEVAGPSKSALKKAAKEKEKAEKAAKRAEEERLRKEKSEADDTSKHLYGKLEDGLTQTAPETTTTVKLIDLGPDSVDKSVSIRARVHNARVQSAKLAFLDLRQRTENIQAVIAEGGEHTISRNMVKALGSLNRESIVLVSGVLQAPHEPIHSATLSNLELHVKSCFIVSEGPVQLPIQIKDAMRPPPAGEEDATTEGQEDSSGAPIVSLSTRLDNRVLSLRPPTEQAIFHINGVVCQLFREHMINNKFDEIQTPKIAGAATEGGSGVFEINYFNSPAFLTQSPQFYKQMAIAADMERVFEIGPVFRAENSNTPRHLTEFTGLDFEMEIQNTWEEIIDHAEDLLGFIFRGLRERCKYWMEVIQRVYPDAGNFKIPEGRAPRLRFADGIKMLKEAGIEASADEDINTTNEKTLGRLVFEKYNTDFYFLTHYPSAARPFYTHTAPKEPHLTHSYDAFMRGQEICSGAQRIHDTEMLMKRMKSMDPPLNPDQEGFRHYVDAFRMGCAPHGGGGFGLNRITMLWLGLPNIRQATLFPRDPQRKAP